MGKETAASRGKRERKEKDQMAGVVGERERINRKLLERGRRNGN